MVEKVLIPLVFAVCTNSGKMLYIIEQGRKKRPVV